MSLLNFSPKEFIYSELMDPVKGTNWHPWFKGYEPRISQALAFDMWESLFQAENNFVSPFPEWNPPKNYVLKNRQNSIDNIEKDMNIFFGKLQALTLKLGTLLHPFDLNCGNFEDKDLDENIIKTLAAYSILCIDLAITGLLEKKTNTATLSYAYAVIALSLCRAHKNQTMPNGTLSKLVRSQIGRENANKYHDQTTRLMAADVVKYWKANIDPKLSMDKAAEELMIHFGMPFTTVRKYIVDARKAEKAVNF